MQIQFKKLATADSRKYREIRLESLKNFPEGFGATYEEESKAIKLDFETHIEQQAIHKFIIGAFDKENLIGICGFYQEASFKTKHRGGIIQMYVKPNYKGNGIGLQLLNTTIVEAFKIPELEQLILGVVTNNISANKIYEKAGFQEYGIQRNYFKEGDKYLDQRFMILYRAK